MMWGVLTTIRHHKMFGSQNGVREQYTIKTLISHQKSKKNICTKYFIFFIAKKGCSLASFHNFSHTSFLLPFHYAVCEQAKELKLLQCC
jgi:hypothetical protein